MSSFYLPEELVLNILSRLLPKTLIRFRCVSKTLLALIGTLDFVSDNILNHSILATKSQNPNPQLLLVKSTIQPRCDKQTYSFLSYDTLLDCGFRIPLNLPLRPVPRRQLNHPYPTPYLDLNIVASCDGLLCLYDYTRHSNVYLWNPFNAATPTELEVPPPMTRGYYMLNYKFVGFGFDSRSNDFKIVRIYSDCVAECMAGFTRKLYPGEVGIGKGVGVYSLSTGSWRQVEHDPKMVSGILPYRHMTAYMNGLFFWLAADEDGGDDNRIVAFDFSTEVFNMTPLPDKSVIGVWRSLMVLNGFIAMVIYSSMSDNLGFDIWVLLEFGVKESWTKLITIDPSLDLKRPLLFWKSGQIFMENTKGQLVLYDPFTQTTKNVQLDGHKGSVRVVPYTQSLVNA